MTEQFEPVVLKPYTFSSLLMSGIEVYDRESLGFLIGHPERDFIKGAVSNCLSIQSAYPVQSAQRRRYSVEFGNLAARKRIEESVRAVGFDIAGGFHSHPNGSFRLSDDDVDVIFTELEDNYSKTGITRWLEIILGILRIEHPESSVHLKKYFRGKSPPKSGFYPRNDEPGIVGDLLLNTSKCYRIKMAGYWFEGDEVEEANLVYSLF